MDEGGPGEGRGASVNKELRLLCTQRAEPTPPRRGPSDTHPHCGLQIEDKARSSARLSPTNAAPHALAEPQLRAQLSAGSEGCPPGTPGAPGAGRGAAVSWPWSRVQGAWASEAPEPHALLGDRPSVSVRTWAERLHPRAGKSSVRRRRSSAGRGSLAGLAGCAGQAAVPSVGARRAA